MTAKGSGCGDCCCSLCGKKLADPDSLCCYCVCDTLCVTVTGGGVVECPPTTGTGSGDTCGCVEVTGQVDWDDTQCAWVGTIACGSLSIDLKFEILRLGDDCYLCLTSECLGFVGMRTGTGTDDECDPIIPGCNEGCGDYVKDGTQTGGLNGQWTVDASDCGDLMCTSVTIDAECMDRTNPAGSGTSRICKDCDCVCNCICLSYEEIGEDDCGVQIARVCWRPETGTDELWQYTFTGCPGGSQTVTITIERGDGGCCEWHLDVTRGTVIRPNVLTQCPDATHTWELADLGEGVTGNVTIQCAACNVCDVQTTCCPDPLPASLTGTLLPSSGCEGVSGTVTLSLTSINEEPPGNVIVVYEGLTTLCGSTLEFALTCNAASWILVMEVTSGGSCGSTIENGGSPTDFPCCSPLHLSFETIGSDCEEPCCEPGQTFGIVITE